MFAVLLSIIFFLMQVGPLGVRRLFAWLQIHIYINSVRIKMKQIAFAVLVLEDQQTVL